MSKFAKTYFPSVNGLRAISILLVIIHHLSMKNDIFQGLNNNEWLSPFIRFAEDGHMGVNVFFVISGFLITTLLLEEEAQRGKISLKNFFIRRTLRIFPAYYFLLLVYGVLQVLNFIEISGASWLSALTYTKYFNWDLDWITSHAWSLSIEEHFYLFWPLFFIVGPKFRKWAAWLLVLMVPFFRMYANAQPGGWIYELSIFTRVDSIAIGCLFALYRESIVKLLSPHWRIIFLGSILALFGLRYYPALLDIIYPGASEISIALGVTHGTIANLLIAMIMMYAVFGPQKLFYRALNSKVLNYIGLLSYSIYLWQQIFISGEGHWVNLFPQNIFLVVGMALFSYYIIELPFLKIKRKFSSEKAERNSSDISATTFQLEQ